MKNTIVNLFATSLLMWLSSCAPMSRSIASGNIEATPVASAPQSIEEQAPSLTAPKKFPAAVAPLTHATPTAHGTPADHHAPAGVAPETALKWLKNGNFRYTHNKLRKDGQSHADRVRLAKGQKPHTIVVSCSDSRVPPEMVFDQKLGEIFVIRTAGEILDYGATASIEYAVEHLGAQLVLFMGHESCGAVKAAIDTPEGQSAGSKDLDRLVRDIRPRIAGVARAPASSSVIAETSANAKGAAAELIQKSDIVRKLVNEGKLSVQSAVYHLQSGEVTFN